MFAGEGKVILKSLIFERGLIGWLNGDVDGVVANGSDVIAGNAPVIEAGTHHISGFVDGVVGILAIKVKVGIVDRIVEFALTAFLLIGDTESQSLTTAIGNIRVHVSDRRGDGNRSTDEHGRT